jgi:hypothetical protein
MENESKADFVQSPILEVFRREMRKSVMPSPRSL